MDAAPPPRGARAGRLSVLGCACVLGAPALGRAQAADPPTRDERPDSAESLAREARALYEAGQYEQAVAVYLRAWRAEQATAVLYNIAVIYDRKLDEPELAADYYRRYIRAEDADPAAVERATLRLRALKSRASEADAPPRVAAPPASTETPEPAPAPTMTTATTAGASPAATSRTLGWVSLGVGGAALASGGVLAALALSAQGDFGNAETVPAKRAAKDRGEALALAADVSFGVAAVGLGLGVWWLLDAREGADPEASEDRASLSAAPLAGGGLLVWRGTL